LAVPIQTQLFDAFLGTQEGIHSIILPDIYSSGGSKNLWIDKYGRAKKISGYTKQNATPVTTDTGASATLVRALHPYRVSSSGVFVRTLFGVFDDGVDECEVWASDDDGATWAVVQDLGAASVGAVPDFAQLGSILIFTNGQVAPRAYDGTNWTTAGGTQLAAPTISGSASGNLTGKFKWKVVPIKTDGSRKVASVASDNTVLSDQNAPLTWAADSDVTVNGYEVYRTTGTGAVFYYVDSVSGRTTVTYTDNVPDLNILENRVLEEHGDPPPTAYHCESHKQRMWYLRTDAAPQRGYWSDPGDPDSVFDENFIEFADAETLGDVITGAIGDFEGHLVVFQERSVWTISGTGQIIGDITDWTRTRTNAQTGAVSYRAVVRVPGGSKFSDQNGETKITDAVTLAYFTPLGDIRLFDGDNDVIISHPVKTLLSTFNYAQKHKIVAVHDTPRSEITWLFPTGSSGEPTTGVTWNYRWGVWYEREWAFSSAIEVESASDASIILAGSSSTSTGGYVYLLWSGNSADGSNISARWMTKTLYGVNQQSLPALTNTKRWRWADFMFEIDNSVTLTVEWLPANAPDDADSLGSVLISPSAAYILTSDGDRLVTANGDPLVVSEATAQVQALLKSTDGRYLHDEGIRLRVGDNSSNGSWSLEGMALAYQILPGLKRRF
jgi:hypothetical protein